MADVFISYHDKSAGKLAEQIADELESTGISCWYAGRDMPSTNNYTLIITEQITACKIFLPILDEGSSNSPHVFSETSIAFERRNQGQNITFVPFKVENCDFRNVEYYLSGVQIMDGVPPDAERIQMLASKIRETLRPDSAQIRKNSDLMPLPPPPLLKPENPPPVLNPQSHKPKPDLTSEKVPSKEVTEKAPEPSTPSPPEPETRNHPAKRNNPFRCELYCAKFL